MTLVTPLSLLSDDAGQHPLIKAAQTVSVVPITAAMVSEVVDIHLVAFSDFANSRLGRSYAYALIEWFRRQEEAIALAALADGRVVGYVVGAPLGYQHRLNRDLLRVAAGSLLSRPWLWLDRGIRHKLSERFRSCFRRQSASRTTPWLPSPTMSLVAVGVSAELQGYRIGDRLVEAFEANARVRRMQSLRLSVKKDNAAARKLYERRGWRPSPCPDKELLYYAFTFPSIAAEQPMVR